MFGFAIPPVQSRCECACTRFCSLNSSGHCQWESQCKHCFTLWAQLNYSVICPGNIKWVSMVACSTLIDCKLDFNLSHMNACLCPRCVGCNTNMCIKESLMISEYNPTRCTSVMHSVCLGSVHCTLGCANASAANVRVQRAWCRQDGTELWPQCQCTRQQLQSVIAGRDVLGTIPIACHCNPLKAMRVMCTL